MLHILFYNTDAPQKVPCGGAAPEEGVGQGVHFSQTWDKLHFLEP